MENMERAGIKLRRYLTVNEAMTEIGQIFFLILVLVILSFAD